ncbi:hypothetical protein ZYGR_0AZ02360 [Zygosaccharomyces rouxii]|uniref:MMS19 nucleotide excision repair protein n=1 Tax=Zygosaccharomyces rouxii TaxID=4956 RepID=A0A1Q3AK37_ZYGRO|nr:hypothetical protein ZYGR_0AZ02360 [Zygosaccharomyces rouxii]
MANEESSIFLETSIVSFVSNVDIDEGSSDKTATQIAERISDKKFKLLDLIVSLRDYLTSQDLNRRRKALCCLSTVLSKLPDDKLLKNEVSVVLSFYSSKADDTLMMKETLSGIYSLSGMKYLSISEVSPILEILKNKYNPSSHLAATRYFAFKILEKIYERFDSKLVEDGELADLFVQTFLHVGSGEKDPRNLLSSFRINELISSNWSNVDKFKEDLFDILFCYFPITFRPPKDDPYKISNADLKISLRSAISASPVFAEDAFGNLIDKLAASSPSVKNDTLLTLKACIDKFGGEACLKHWLPLWSSLKFEIMHGNDAGYPDSPSASTAQISEADNYQLSVNIMRSIASALLQFDEKAFDKFLSHIVEEVKPNFTYEKDLKQTCCLLGSIASANEQIFNKVVTLVLPLFFKNSPDLSKLKLEIMNFSFFFDAYIRVFGEANDKQNEVPSNSLSDQKDEILMVLSRALTASPKVEVTIRTLSIIQFTKLIKMKGFLMREEIALIVQYISEAILTDNNKNIYHAGLESLKVIGEIHEDIVFEVSLKRMLELLPTDPNEGTQLNDNEPVEKETILKALLDFTNSRHKLVKESVLGLSKKLCQVAPYADSSEYCFLIISAIHTLLSNNIEMIRENDAAIIKENIEMPLFTAMTNHSSLQKDDHNLTLLSNILFFLNLKSPRNTHQDELTRYKKYFVENLQLFVKPSRLVVPFEKLLCGIDKSCEFSEIEHYFALTMDLLRRKEIAEAQFERLGYLELLTVFANKWMDEESLLKFTNLEDLSPVNLEMLVWMVKGLVMKNSPQAVLFQEKFVSLLSNLEIGDYVAKLFEVFVVDIITFQKYKGISWNNNVKLTYKQKFFNDVFSRLVGAFKNTSEMVIKSNYLTALSLVSKHISSNLIEPYMDEMLPLLLQSLDMPNSEVKVSALNTLLDTCEKFHQLITEHVQTLSRSLLRLISPNSYNNVSVRVLSLRLLETLTQVVPLNYILPFKEEIIDGSLPVLDDRKRIVRKQCVSTRQAYFELGQVPFE